MSTVVPHSELKASEALRHPLHSLEEKVHVLAEVERLGESGETVVVSTARVACVIVPMGALMMLLAFGAAWLFG